MSQPFLDANTSQVHISVEAYGENRFNMTYDPCKANIYSMCPLNATNPIEAFAAIPISPADVSGIPTVALSIPDFEGLARMRIFANSTETEIGCFQAVMTNGQSLSQPAAIGSFIGVVAFFAMIASFITAVYGLSVPHMRMHYAHSFSILVIIETFQSIFFSGALSVSWPSVLPAWWSNFAWASGMIANKHLVRAISSFTGNDVDVSQVGGAGSTTINNNGGLTQQIYGRSTIPDFDAEAATEPLHALSRRQPYNASNPYDYTWNGDPRAPGMPMPGTWPGFAGTLSTLDIPPAEAFTLGLIWLLVITACVALLIVLFKFTLDFMIKFKVLKTDGFDYFRSHLAGYVAAGVLRTLFIAFFSMMTLTMYQFTLHAPAGPTAIAVILFLVFFVGMGGIVAYACYFRLRHGKYQTSPDTIRFESSKVFTKVPFVTAIRNSQRGEEETVEPRRLFATVPITRITYTDDDPNRLKVHQDEGYIKRFGWLSARYRRTRWWFFAFYLGYQFVRACFIGGGVRTPLAQVFGLFLFEIIAVLIIMKLDPFEGSRNTSVAVWMLSISKIVTTGLSIGFLPDYNLNRIVTTVLGIIIVVVQGFVTVAVLVLIVLGLISSWMSLSRNREEFNQTLSQVRVRYFERMQERSDDLPKPKPKKGEEKDPEPIEPFFNVKDVRRAPKIEDEDEDAIGELQPQPWTVSNQQESGRRSRANSASSRYSAGSLPRAARGHRASWSSREFAQMQAELMARPESQRIGHSRNSSLRMSTNASNWANDTIQGANTPAVRPMTPTRESFEDGEKVEANASDAATGEGTKENKTPPNGDDATTAKIEVVETVMEGDGENDDKVKEKET